MRGREGCDACARQADRPRCGVDPRVQTQQSILSNAIYERLIQYVVSTVPLDSAPTPFPPAPRRLATRFNAAASADGWGRKLSMGYRARSVMMRAGLATEVASDELLGGWGSWSLFGTVRLLTPLASARSDQ